MRGLFGRRLRLALIGTGIAAGSVAFAMPVMAASDGLPTQTRLDAQTRVVAREGRNFTEGVFSVTVTGADGQAASGAVTVEDGDKAIGGAVLDATGKATVTADLPAGEHSLRAVYEGDDAHAASVSATAEAKAQADSSGTPDFQVTLKPASLTLTQGQSGDVVVSLTPVDSGALTASMFVTLSCSGFPDQSTCTFTPENVEIQPGATAAVTSDMVLATQAQPVHGAQLVRSSGTALAIVIPGAVGLMGLAAFARKGGWARLVMIMLVALVGSLGMTACNPRYNYFNHGPPYNLPTPVGTYQMKVTAQSSNGVTAITHPVTFVLTVNAASTTSSSSN